MRNLLLVAVVAVISTAIVTVALAGNGDMDQTQQKTQDQAKECTPGDCCEECVAESVCELCIDEDGDGICDNCDADCTPEPQGPDDDGDGTPNGQDDDYVPPQDGTGAQHRGGE